MNVEYMGHFGSDLTVVNAARCSLDKQHDFFDASDERLINYLAREQHWTPFGHPQVQLRIHAPIFIARQWFRSAVGVIRSEVSRRYVDSEPEFFVPIAWRARPDGSIKQGSGDVLDDESSEHCFSLLDHAHNRAKAYYEDLLDLGVAPEQARMVLPQSMYTTWIETGSLAYWARVYGLRAEAHAQVEIQELARMMGAIVAEHFPVSWRALTDAPANNGS